jgi:glucosamine--fructose-6-phosphate aminotransferase (isomerizing)
MFGIVGYIGSNPALDFLIDGLKKLEYRGYDSSGIVVFNEKPYLKKCQGKISKLEKTLKEKELKSLSI